MAISHKHPTKAVRSDMRKDHPRNSRGKLLRADAKRVIKKEMETNN